MPKSTSYIGDSKYYPDDSHAEDVALYKQFTYARNAIQYNIDQYYIRHKKNPDAIRYRDKETEGYNVTPNFFISPKIESDNLDFTRHSFAATTWEHEPNRHFEDRQVMKIPFLNYHHNRVCGKVYKIDDDSTSLVLAFEKKTEIGKKDLADAEEHLSSSVEGGTLGKPEPLKP